MSYLRTRSLCPLIGAAFLAAGNLVSMGQSPKAKPAPAEPPVKVGAASVDEIGSLPPLTVEISKRAAKAFLEGDWPQARDAYLEILKAAPDNALTLANLGATYLRMGEFTSAKEKLNRALELQPNLHRARVTLGQTYLDAGDFYLAISTLSRAVAEQPRDAQAHNYLAVAARELGWVDGAERELQAAVAADPSFAEAHFNLALVYMERRLPAVELARRHYYRAVDLGATPDPALVRRIDAAARK